MESCEMVILLPRCDKKITITLAFDSGNGHFYHISVIEFTISWDPIR